MPAGLQVWDASGQLVIDLANRLTRIIGMVDTGGTSGSISVPGFSQGTPFYAVVPLNAYLDSYQLTARASVTGNTLSWTSGVSSRIIYGVY